MIIFVCTSTRGLNSIFQDDILLFWVIFLNFFRNGFEDLDKNDKNISKFKLSTTGIEL